MEIKTNKKGERFVLSRKTGRAYKLWFVIAMKVIANLVATIAIIFTFILVGDVAETAAGWIAIMKIKSIICFILVYACICVYSIIKKSF